MDSPSEARGLRIKFSIMIFIFQATMAAVGYIVAFLQEQGLSTTQVGVVMAFSSVVMMVAPPLWGMLADKLRSLRRVFLLCLVLATVCYGLTPLISQLSGASVVLMTLILTAAAFFRAPTSSLSESWVVATTRQHPSIAYGHIRLWGSIGYALFSMALMYAVSRTSLGMSFYFYGIAAIGSLLVCLRLPDEARDTQAKPLTFRQLQIGRLFKSYWLGAFLLFLVLRGVSLYCSNNFLPFLVTDVGGDTALLGAINALRALCEVPLLFLSQKLIRRFGMVPLIITSSILYVIGELGYAFVQSVWQIMAVQAMAGIAYGLFVSCQVQYVATIAPKGLSSTAQTLAAALPAMTGIFGNPLAGWIMDNIGLRAYYLISAIILFSASFLFMVSFPIGTRLLKQALPDTRLRD